MAWLRSRGIGRRGFAVILIPVAALIMAACTSAELELLQGILQDVDTVSGEITIVTEDGRTITFTIESDADVDTVDSTTTLEGLETGATVNVEVDDDDETVARHVRIRLRKVEGRITAIAADQITILDSDDEIVTVSVNDATNIELEDDFAGVLSDLQVGGEVKVKFDPRTNVAFKIDIEEEDEEIEGTLVEVDDDEITVETERGRRLTLEVTDRTRVEFEDDVPGNISDLPVGTEVEVKFDPARRLAFKIEVEDDDQAEIEGLIVTVDGNDVTIESESGRTVTVTVDERTRIEIEDDLRGTIDDLAPGLDVEAKFNPITSRAAKIEVEDGDQAEIEGLIVSVDGNNVTIESEGGRAVTVIVDERTRIEIEDDLRGTIDDLAPGLDVEAKFNPITSRAAKIEVEDGEEDGDDDEDDD